MEKNRKTLLAVAAIVVAVAVIVAAVSLSQSKPAGGEEKELAIYAAASLTASFTELGKAYEDAHPGTKVNLEFDGSGNLRGKIMNGAAVDVFASADLNNMGQLSAANMMDGSTIQTFAKNKVVIIVPTSNPGNIHGLADLTKDGLQIVIGNKTGVPVGGYTDQILDKISADTANYSASYKADVLDNVASYTTNVNQIVAAVATGNADAGFVYSTDASTAIASGSQLTVIEIPDQYNVVATYPIGVLADSHLPDDAQAFVDFVLSTEGQNILASYGFVKV